MTLSAVDYVCTVRCFWHYRIVRIAQLCSTFYAKQFNCFCNYTADFFYDNNLLAICLITKRKSETFLETVKLFFSAKDKKIANDVKSLKIINTNLVR